MNGTYRTIRTVLSALCLMVLLCSCFSALAEDAWTCPACGQTGNTGNFCPQCGKERPSLEWTCSACGTTGNTGNFCPQCGKPRYPAHADAFLTEEPATVRPTATPRPTFTPTPKPTATPRPTYTPTPRPTATPSVKLASSLSYRDGKTTIKWTGGGSDTYSVYIKAINGSSDQHIWNLGSSSSGSLTTAALMPGKKYEVTLRRSFFSIADSRTYTIPDVPLFEDGKLKNTSVKVSIEPRKLAKGDEYSNAKKVNGLSASTIISAIKDGNESYGFKYQMRMPQLAKPRTFYVTIYIESPDGYLDAEIWSDITFDRVNNGYQTIWFHFLGGDYFKDMYDTTGNVPAGNYKITMYWDGMFVNESVLKISK